MPNLKFLASTVPEICTGSQNSKSRSLDPFTTPFDLILHFFVRTPVANLFAKFEVSSFNRSWDMEGVPKFTDWLTDSLTHSHTDTKTDFIISPMLLMHWAGNNCCHVPIRVCETVSNQKFTWVSYLELTSGRVWTIFKIENILFEMIYCWDIIRSWNSEIFTSHSTILPATTCRVDC